MQGAKLFLLKNDLPYNRICFTFSRGFGNAVARNRARRLGREAFRMIKPRLSGGYDLILLVYPESSGSGITFSDRMKQLEFLFSKAGLLIWREYYLCLSGFINTEYPRIFRRFAGIIRAVRLMLTIRLKNTGFFRAAFWQSGVSFAAIHFARAAMIRYHKF